MKISGFTMNRNAHKLYYPAKQSILSILPVVDEFVVALGACDKDDITRKEIESIGSDKIRIIDTVWDIQKYPQGMEHAHQTDIAKEHCTGDWLFYLQADEVVHENDLPVITEYCEKYVDDKRVEGFLFNYYHFWGDYDHYHKAHGWYKKEIRIIRNDPDIHSWKSAQSFRKIPGFNGLDYRQENDTYKLKVIKIPAYIYHYGWVRPPELMNKKRKAFYTIHKGEERAKASRSRFIDNFHYGNLSKIPVFKGTHPKVMQEWIKNCRWKDQLHYSGKIKLNRTKIKHEKSRNRILSFFENLFNISLGSSKNYILVKRK